MPSKLLIYGATGFVGGHIARTASAYGPDFVLEAEAVTREDL
jgi:short subunit dehydrogenase-like uncharacterized protein